MTHEVLEVRRRAEQVTCPGDLLPAVGRILVARTDRLGDLLLTLPTLAALREGYPQAELELLVNPRLVEIAELFEGVDHVAPMPDGTAALTVFLRRRRPDVLVCVARNGRLAVASARARVPHRIGTGRRFYSPLFTRRVEESRRGSERHEVEYALSFAHRMGAPAGPARFGLRAPRRERQRVVDWLARHGLTDGNGVVLHPGSGGSCPAWPLERYQQLAGRFESVGQRVVWSYGPGEAMPEGPGAHFAGSLPALAALLEVSAGIVSNSTGPLHLAVALGRPALAIHAPWSGCGVQRWGPYGAGGAGIVANAEGAERWTHGERRRKAEALMAGLPVAPVFVEAQRRFAPSTLPGGEQAVRDVE